MHLEQAQRIEHQYVCQVYARTPLLLVRGEGMNVWDDEGRRYLDFCSGGRAVNALGHCHPRVVEAIQRQATVLLHTSNDYYTSPQVRLAEWLAQHCVCTRALFCNSGAEANEAAIKLARKHGKRDSTERVEFVTTLKSFHGRTMGALTATGQPKYQQGFSPMVPGFHYVPYNDLAAMDEAITDRTCAVMLEPVQGESGVYPATPEYMAGLRRLCDERGAVLILDEVQTGLGRTGKLFAYEHYGIEPDIVTISKALGGGMPIGAMLAKDSVASAFAPGDHGTTFGGSPIAAAAALAAVTAIIDERLVENAAVIGAYLTKKLAALQQRLPVITGFRVMGCMAGVDLAQPIAAEVKARSQERGVLFVTVGDAMLRLLPALICQPAQVDEALDTIADIMEEVIATSTGCAVS
ncbi:MAG TPA: aspartate aminotransferase family protein [Armatimonadota bacterium]|jgi:predicted acetylornithine/succinylornithine family transaminase